MPGLRPARPDPRGARLVSGAGMPEGIVSHRGQIYGELVPPLCGGANPGGR